MPHPGFILSSFLYNGRKLRCVIHFYIHSINWIYNLVIIHLMMVTTQLVIIIVIRVPITRQASRHDLIWNYSNLTIKSKTWTFLWHSLTLSWLVWGEREGRAAAGKRKNNIMKIILILLLINYSYKHNVGPSAGIWDQTQMLMVLTKIMFDGRSKQTLNKMTCHSCRFFEHLTLVYNSIGELLSVCIFYERLFEGFVGHTLKKRWTKAAYPTTRPFFQ